MSWPSPPSTRILSWNQLVREADPNWTRQSLQPWCYEFSNGRLFVDTLPTYTPYDLIDDLLLTETDLPLQLVGGGPIFLVSA